MSEIILPLKCIFGSGRYDRSKLETVDTWSEEDQEYYDSHSWKSYRPEYHQKTLLPELGEPRHFDRMPVVVAVKGRRYKVDLSVECWGDVYDAAGKTVTLAGTEDPETEFEPGKYRSYYRFFGQPRWVQGEHFPADLHGRPCYHFFTVENSWGDCGNWNILLGLGLDDSPEVAYFEASCC